MLENIMSTMEAAHFLKLTQRRVAGLCAIGELAGAIKIGQTWAIPKLSVQVYATTHGNGKRSRKTKKEQETALA